MTITRVDTERNAPAHGQEKYVGRRVPGLNNVLLVAGKGTYVDDVQLPGLCYLAVVRSPYAHARIASIDSTEAEKLPGVRCVITGPEIVEATDPIPETFDGSAVGARSVVTHALRADRVRYAGEPVAAVVADDARLARQAADLVEVDYEELESVTDAVEALGAGSALVEPDWGDNLFYALDATFGEPERAFAEAFGVVTGTLRLGRLAGVPMEPRGCVAAYDAYRDLLTLWSSTQNPHGHRIYLAKALRTHESNLRVIQPNVGGSFGTKIPTHHEDVLVSYAARKLKVPVKWTEERWENLQSGSHSREFVIEYEAAYRESGQLTGLRATLIADIGAPSPLCGWGMAWVAWFTLPGPYRIDDLDLRLRTVATNKCPWNAYRGYGKDVAAFVMDRVVDHVARATGRDTRAIRYRNFIPSDEFPYTRTTGATVDSANFEHVMDRLNELVDYDTFREQQAKARAEGIYLGLGFGQELTPEGGAIPGSLILSGTENVDVRISPRGEVTVLSGASSSGGGNETGIAQIVADELGCTLKRIRVPQGDTDVAPYGLGSSSARVLMFAGSAAKLAAADLRAKLVQVAASMLGAEAVELDAGDDRIFVRLDPDRSLTFEEVVSQVYEFPHGKHMDGLEPALRATRGFRMGNVFHQPENDGRFNVYPSWSNGAAAAVVEVDPETGQVKLRKYYYVHDSGVIVNPLLVEAQLHGAIAQGLGGAMYEEVVYDDEGQPLTLTLMDYTIPTAVEMPQIVLGHVETPSPFTELGQKGAGESGIGGVLGALCGAVEDALPDLPLRLNELPITPWRVWHAIAAARESVAAGLAEGDAG